MYDVALNCFGNEAMVTKKSESIVRSTGKVEIVGDTLLPVSYTHLTLPTIYSV